VDEGNCGAEPYALRVVGDSMAPEVSDGNIIIVDPSGVISDGCYVVALHQEEYIFRQLVIESGRYYLRTLRDGEDPVRIDGPASIAGVVVQKAGRRRADRKHYI
jgi:DNA polymerase V